MARLTARNNYKGVWDSRIGFGSNPAVLMIDFVKGYTTEGSPLYAGGVVAALEESRNFLLIARSLGVPIIHTRIQYFSPKCEDGGVWVKKAPVMRLMAAGNALAEFCEEVAPLANELVLTKQYASSFFGTSMASTLHAMGVDTIVLLGCSTSGCIRATAVDGLQNGFRTIVVRECVGDRDPYPHEANLFDIDSKYADVMSKAEAIAALQDCRRTGEGKDGR